MDLLKKLSGRKVFLLSPHPDDIAFSIGGFVTICIPYTIARLFTYFSQSRWNGKIGRRIDNYLELSAQRMSEDLLFAGHCNAGYTHFSLADSSLRFEEDFLKNTERSLETHVQFEAVMKCVSESISIIMTESSVDQCSPLVFCPLGLGAHVDHLLLTKSYHSFCIKNKFNTVYYEDLPHASTLGLSDIEKHIKSLLGDAYTPFLFYLNDDTWAEKLCVIDYYKTQLEEDTIHKIESHSLRLGQNKQKVERLWVPKL